MTKGSITILEHYLPAGTAVGGNPCVINRHKATFGEDAELWRPERWLEHDESHKKKLDHAMLTISSSPPFISHILNSLSIQVWCWQTYLFRKEPRNHGNREDTAIPHSHLRCKFNSQLHERHTRRELTNAQTRIVDL